MSIASLADDEILRTERRNLQLDVVVDPHLETVMQNFNIPADRRPQMRAALRPVAAASPIQRTPQSDTLDGLVRYIPTETITLYVAATAAFPTLKAIPFVTERRLYWAFVALTPILFSLIYMGKRRSQNLPFVPNSLKEGPWWKLIASTVAFMVWALAIPPLIDSPGGKVAAAFGALFVSTMLGLIGAVVEPPTTPPPPQQ